MLNFVKLESTHRVQTSANEYVLVHNVNMVYKANH